ncbi:tetratricopeptide repeat protein [uncultured Chryseobacterium sp.]|uniref:tetratricopeptide repeat protein n=1 Tax=uncultured Chryseobacterium sp. TaxID=259322 RepID=UPI00261DAB52|nr:tetratricopeptide repeat protein [uncultured Chryseobacterium sp.]
MFIGIGTLTFAQKNDNQKLPSPKEILKELTEAGCKCLDSIDAYNKTKDAINMEISSCIDVRVLPYMLSKTLSKVDLEKGDKKEVTVNINSNPNSSEYKQAYNELESSMMDNCPELRNLAAVAESMKEHHSNDPIALEFYNKAIDASSKEDWKEAIKNYKLALEKDPKFVYAWDNIGVCYRRIGEYDNALNAYKKSLEIDPKGKVPLQNIAMTYIYKKEYQKAIDSYMALDKVYPGDAEVYYGIGQIYYEYLKENEKALDYMAKAYNVYTKQKSPYRSDAETIIGYIYKKMKDGGKTEKFKEILKNNNIGFE